MSVDKFGHSPKGSDGTARGERGIGFQLTPDNHFDIQDRRLTKVGEGVDDKDATTLEQLIALKRETEQKIDDFQKQLGQKIDLYLTPFKQKIALDLGILERNVILFDKDEDVFKARKKRIRDVAFPRAREDAVNKLYVDNFSLRLNTEKKFYQAEDKPIRDLGAPTLPTDAATMKYVNENKGLSVIKFFVTSPLVADSQWAAYSYQIGHTITAAAKLVKAVLYTSEITPAYVVRCDIGTEENLMISKLDGSQSNPNYYFPPKCIPENTIIQVHNVQPFTTEKINFHLDLYISYD